MAGAVVSEQAHVRHADRVAAALVDVDRIAAADGGLAWGAWEASWWPVSSRAPDRSPGPRHDDGGQGSPMLGRYDTVVHATAAGEEERTVAVAADRAAHRRYRQAVRLLAAALAGSSIDQVREPPAHRDVTPGVLAGWCRVIRDDLEAGAKQVADRRLTPGDAQVLRHRCVRRRAGPRPTRRGGRRGPRGGPPQGAVGAVEAGPPWREGPVSAPGPDTERAFRVRPYTKSPTGASTRRSAA